MTVFLVFPEAALICFILLLICAVGIADGPANLVVFYEKEVQLRAVSLGLTTEKRIRRSRLITTAAIFLPVAFLVPAMVSGLLLLF